VITVRSILYYQGLFLKTKPIRVTNLKDFHLRTGRDKTKRKTQKRMERRSRKSSSSAGSEKMERVGDRKGKVERYCSTGQSPQRAVAPTEEEKEEEEEEEEGEEKEALISQIYFWNETLHVSDSSSVHHQEFLTVHTAMVYVIQIC
jgi:hypothetical protein